MNAPFDPISRRSVLKSGGALVVSFSLSPVLAQEKADPTASAKPTVKLPGSLAKDPYLDSWIRIDAKGSITVLSGKAELGQGIKTALIQVAAEELDVPFDRIELVTADTGRTVNEGYTAGSHSMQDSATAIRNAAAQMRDLLIVEAARKFSTSPDQLKTDGKGTIVGTNINASYGSLAESASPHIPAQPVSNFRDPLAFKVMNTSVPRVDIPAKVTGGESYVQDMRLPGMLHARVVRPPSYGAKLDSVDLAAIDAMPGVMKTIRNGDFLAVVAKEEFQAVKAMRALAVSAHWLEKPSLPANKPLPDVIRAMPSKDSTILDIKNDTHQAKTTIEATYTRPYQSHGSIGPSCAVAQYQSDELTIWTHTQGVYPDRAAIAEMLKMPNNKVRCIHVQGSGCYGHNGADDAAADAALIALALNGPPVRVQWMREQEHAWEPFGPGMVTKASASLDDSGKIVDWNYDVWSNTHSMRPGKAGSLLAAQHIESPFLLPPPTPLPLPEGGGDRNAIPLYALNRATVVHHFLPDMPLRISAMRSLGAYTNVFAIESFMDELAREAGHDPVAFRLAHLTDERGRDVIVRAADEFGWAHYNRIEGRGRGFAFARYKNLAAYCALAMEVEVNRETGRVRVVRAVSAVDAGQIVNPDGVRNQIEGAILQATSWTLYEGVTFDDARITSIDWSTYPILRFDAVPDVVDVHIVDRPGLPFLGAGEAGQGPTAAAIANAITDATGRRLRDLPFTASKVKDAIGI
ncbi:molybdopterin cofactor-binding domain-containing protein [Bradyrhizobium sp. SYSU BS000235]|uniref:xanthine dehydrogenase family protein molybdopterin-binding subunit n=1 Tax=Bradyrhizobium sp. SYSU BS000235 TaxID=3411332 RepID=UPI003C77D172